MNEISSIKCSCWWAGKPLSVVQLRERILIEYKALLMEMKVSLKWENVRPHCWCDMNMCLRMKLWSPYRHEFHMCKNQCDHMYMWKHAKSSCEMGRSRVEMCFASGKSVLLEHVKHMLNSHVKHVKISMWNPWDQMWNICKISMWNP